MEPVKVTELLVNDGSNAAGLPVAPNSWRDSGRASVAATLLGAGAIASSIAVEGSHDGVHFAPIGTIALDANDADTGVLGIDYPWPFLRATSSGQTGTTTKLRVTLAQ